jgi:hypothetical protein
VYGRVSLITGVCGACGSLSFFDFPHRFAAAFFAISLRCSFVSFAALAFPPFDPRLLGSDILNPLLINYQFSH